jgi:hypothetical protein
MLDYSKRFVWSAGLKWLEERVGSKWRFFRPRGRNVTVVGNTQNRWGRRRSIRPCVVVVPRWCRQGVQVEGRESRRRMFFTVGVGFGGGGSDYEILGGGEDEGRVGGPDFSGTFFPDAGP